MQWILDNIVELTGSLLGIVYVLLASKQNVWCWLVGNISVALYIVVFFMAKLYGDVLLQFFYLIMGFYGWYLWLNNNKENEKTSIRLIDKQSLILLTVITLLGTFIIGFLLSYTDNTIPYWDGFTTALGLAGTWMTAKKYLESWLMWIFANFVCVGVYYYKGLYPTVVFYFIMAVLAYRGYLIWRNELKSEGVCLKK